MKKLFILALVLTSFTVYAQINIPLNSLKGTIITITNQKIDYKDLKYEKGKVTYTNLETNQKEFLYDSSLKSIQETEGAIISTQENKAEATTSVLEKPKDPKLTSKKDIKNYLIKTNNLEYKRGRNLNNIGTAFIAAGAVSFIVGGLSNLSAANKTYAYGEEPKGSPVPLIIGLVGAGTGVVMKLVGHSQMKDVIEGYKNADSRRFTPSYYVLNNKNGVGVMVEF